MTRKIRLEFCFSIPQAVKLFYFPLFSILYQKFLSHIMISETFIYQKLSLFLYSKRNKNQLQPQQFRNWTKSFYCPPKTLSNPLTIVTRFDIAFHIWRLDATIIYLINLSLIITLKIGYRFFLNHSVKSVTKNENMNVYLVRLRIMQEF